jgi:hypothetical protein
MNEAVRIVISNEGTGARLIQLGLLASTKDEIMAELLYLPLSPPASEPRASSGVDTPGEELHEVDDSMGKVMVCLSVPELRVGGC